MNKILTIVIPTYNMEKYLPRCLDSLIVADEQMKQLEVLVVNDGSKDSSSAIAHEYETRYPGTFRVIDKENGNYGSCINRGLKEAQGKYIKILDADDRFTNANLPSFIDRLAVCTSDAVLTNFKVVDIATGETKGENTFRDYADNECLNFDTDAVVHFEMHAVAYRTSMLKQHGYRQTEGISYTDEEWVFYPIAYTDTISYFDMNIYEYYIGREGQTMEHSIYVERIDQRERIVTAMLEYMTTQDVKGYRRENQLYHINSFCCAIYRIELLEKEDFDDTNIMAIERLLKVVDRDTYDRLNGLSIDKYVPVKYVVLWRGKRKRMPDRLRHFLMDFTTRFVAARQEIKDILKVLKFRK